jgi:hypothetical protein
MERARLLKSKLILSLYLLGAIAGLGCPTTAWGIKPYRCRGRIQFTPCKEVANTSNSFTSPRAQFLPVAYDPRFPIKGTRYAEVLTSSFTTLNRSTGLWSGKIRGNGLVETELVIIRRGEIESTRYMGHVWLQNKSTPFKITSSLPKGRGWEWKVRVWAR